MANESENQVNNSPQLPEGEENQMLSQEVDEMITRRPQGAAGYLLTRAWEKITPKQLATLKRMGFGDCSRLTKREASRLIRQQQEETRKLPATEQQEEMLRECGLWQAGMTRGEANRQIARFRRGNVESTETDTVPLEHQADGIL